MKKNIDDLIMHYSRKTKSKLAQLCDRLLHEHKDILALCITGSLGKSQLTHGSDIDIFGIIDTNTGFDERLIAHIISKRLKSSDFSHFFELYPIVSLQSWRWLAKYSTLYCSDLFFAKFLWGNKNLYDTLAHDSIRTGLELENRYSHFVYNLLYRTDQLKIFINSDNLKYQNGGLREMQFIKWVCTRVANSNSEKPAQFLKGLLKINFIDQSHYYKLLNYFQTIMTYKWEKEQKNNILPIEKAYIDYHKSKMLILSIVSRLKQKVIDKFSEYKGLGWKNVLKKARNGSLDKTTRWAMIRSGDESLILCGLWNTDNQDIIHYCLHNLKDYWSVRASIALNPNTSKNQLDLIYDLKMCDMYDIKSFVERHKRYL